MPGPCSTVEGSRWNGLCLCVKRARRKCATAAMECMEGGKDKTISEEEEGRSSRKGGRGGRYEMENCSSFSEKPFERAFLAALFGSMI